MSFTMVSVGGADMAISQQGEEHEGTPRLIWAHGWGQSGVAFQELARSFERLHVSSIIDFPGFGRSAPPPTAWDTAEYADATVEWLRTLPTGPLVWVGHSFGCRVGLQIAARHPSLLTGMVLIAAAGLQRNRTLTERIRRNVRIRAFKLAKLITPEGLARDRLRDWFGSADYKSAGAMRPILVKVVSEDLTEVARSVSCPTLLLYGNQDTETPPEIGARLEKLIKEARLIVLNGYDHHNILTRGQHQVVNEMRKFLAGLK